MSTQSAPREDRPGRSPLHGYNLATEGGEDDEDEDCLLPRSRATIVLLAFNYRTTIVLLRVLHYKTRSTSVKMVFDFQGTTSTYTVVPEF